MQHLHERRERVPASCSGSFLRREIPHYPPSHWPELANRPSVSSSTSRRVTDRGTRNHQSFYFRKLYFGHSRTYLQEPALLRSGGVLSCLTATRFSSLGPLSLPLLSFFYRRWRSEEHTSELQSRLHLVCRLLLEKKKKHRTRRTTTLSQTRHSHPTTY